MFFGEPGHAAARTGQDGRTQVRLLDRGLDPEVKVKTRRKEGSQGSGQDFDAAKSRGLLAPTSTQAQGSDLSGRRWNGPKIGPKPEPKPEPKTGAWSSLLGKTFQHEPQERNPNQTAREGGQQAQGGQDTAGLDQSSPEVSSRVPRRVLGTSQYYDKRAEMFEKNHPDMETPKYYREFGGFFAKKFKELRPSLDDRSKKWVDQTMLDLQLEIEKALQDGTLDETKPGEVDRFATGVHSELYKRNGFGDLPNEDQKKILWTILSEGRSWQLNKLWEGRELAPELFQLILEEDQKNRLPPTEEFMLHLIEDW